MFINLIRLIIVFSIGFFVSGCMSFTAESIAYNTTQVKRTNRPYKFHVVAADSNGSLGLSGVSSLSAPNVFDEEAISRINQQLSEIRPDIYGVENGIPVSIRITSNGSIMVNRDNLVKVNVQIYLDDGELGRKSSCSANAILRYHPFAWAVLNKKTRPTWRNLDIQKLSNVLDFNFRPRTIAYALGEALDKLTEDEILSISKKIPLTRAEIAYRRNIIEADTVYIDKHGKHQQVKQLFTKEDVFEKKVSPRILEQSFSPTTFLGFIKVDVSGISDEDADDFIMTRLIPKICETKGVVWDISGEPIQGYQFIIQTDEKDENNVRTIKFKQLQ